jgi:hypothetical protein
MPNRNLCGRTLGEFVLRERLDDDEGNAGDLYRGEQLLLKRDVIVRVLHKQPDDEALQRFMHDAQLEHPYAAQRGACLLLRDRQRDRAVLGRDRADPRRHA